MNSQVPSEAWHFQQIGELNLELWDYAITLDNNLTDYQHRLTIKAYIETEKEIIAHRRAIHELKLQGK